MKPPPARKKRKIEPPIPLEHDEQVALFQWRDLMQNRIPQLKWMFAVPNGGLRHPVVAQYLKDEGVRRDVPDIVLPFPSKGYHGLYIEMKRIKKSTLRPGQKEFIEYLNSVGYCAVVCKGFEAAKAAILSYLK